MPREKKRPPRAAGSALPFSPRNLERECAIVGAAIALRTTEGRVVVGNVWRADARCVVLRPWGTDKLRRVTWSSIVASKSVGAHGWADAKAVAKRQRRGLSAV